MFEYLKDYNTELKSRVETLEITINIASPLFFSAFRGVVEVFIREIINESGIKTQGTSFKKMISEDGVLDLLTNNLGIENHAIDKCLDLIAKANKRVHDHQGELDIETVISYLICLWQITSPVFISEEFVPTCPTRQEIYLSFNSERRELEREKLKITAEGLERIREQEADAADTNAKVSEMYEHFKTEQESFARIKESAEAPPTLAEIVKKSTFRNLLYIKCDEIKSRRWWTAFLLCIASLIFAPIYINYSTKICGIYTTFTFFVNIWNIATVFMIIRLFQSIDLNISDVDEHTLFNSGTSYIKPIESIKSKYLILLSVAIISMILDIVYANINGAKDVTALYVLLCIGSILFILSFVFTCIYQLGFSAVEHRLNINNKTYSAINIGNNLYTPIDFHRKYLKNNKYD